MSRKGKKKSDRLQNDSKKNKRKKVLLPDEILRSESGPKKKVFKGKKSVESTDDEELIIDDSPGPDDSEFWESDLDAFSSENFEDQDSDYLPSVQSTKEVVSKENLKGPLQDSLVRYIREISRYDLLPIEQEKALTKALAETGNIEIAKELVQANLRLVVKIAMEYRHAYQNVMDLIQEGNIGLMKAVSKFDPDKGAKLSYYASWWIRSYILKFLLDNFRLVKIGTTSEQKKLFYNLLQEKERLMNQGILPETKLLSENLGVSEKAVALMDMRLGSSGQEVSIDRPIGSSAGDSSSGTGSYVDLLSNDAPPIEEVLADAQGMEILQENLKEFVASLRPRDREIFQQRLLSEVPPSLQSLANEYGVSRERIRQIEERLLNKLKVYMSEFIR